MSSWVAQVPLTHDALRMRCRRLCERKGQTGKCAVPDAIHSDYFAGGDKRELLEMALLDAISKHGTGREMYKRVRVSWLYAQNFWGFKQHICSEHFYISIYIYYVFLVICMHAIYISAHPRANSSQRSQSWKRSCPARKMKSMASGWRKTAWKSQGSSVPRQLSPWSNTVVAFRSNCDQAGKVWLYIYITWSLKLVHQPLEELEIQ